MADNNPVVNLGAIDPDKFRVSASDEKGHSERIQARVMPALAHQMQILVEKGGFPYRTKGDMIRHAMMRHLHFLESIGPIPSVTAQMDAINDLLVEEKISWEFQATLEKLGQMVSSYMGSSADGEARRIILETKKHILRMPDGYWRDKYLKELGDRWGQILVNAPRGAFGKLGEGEEG